MSTEVTKMEDTMESGVIKARKSYVDSGDDYLKQMQIAFNLSSIKIRNRRENRNLGRIDRISTLIYRIFLFLSHFR